MSNTTTTTRPRINTLVEFTYCGMNLTGSVTDRDTLDGAFIIIYRDPYCGDRCTVASSRVENLKIFHGK
jgi:hypothetical protein